MNPDVARIAARECRKEGRPGSARVAESMALKAERENATHYLVIDSWAGRKPVRIVGETATKYAVRLLEDCRMPGGNQQVTRAGLIVLVPRYAVHRYEERHTESLGISL